MARKRPDGKPAPVPRDAFSILAEVLNQPSLTAPTTLGSVWAAIPGLDRPGLGGGRPTAWLVEVNAAEAVPTIATLRGLPGLAATEDGRQRLQTELQNSYPRAAEGLVVENLLEVGSPIDGPIARVSWRSPDGTHRSVNSVAFPYLGRGGGFWLIPRLSPTNDVLPPLLLWWALLHALSELARYHPAEWAAALDPDHSRYAVSIEKTLSMALALLPRIVLVVLAPGAYNL